MVLTQNYYNVNFTFTPLKHNNYIKEMSSNYKSEFEYMQIQQTQTRELLNKLGPEIINDMYIKMYELNLQHHNHH